jgi:hypothetical protein
MDSRERAAAQPKEARQWRRTTAGAQRDPGSAS